MSELGTVKKSLHKIELQMSVRWLSETDLYVEMFVAEKE